MVELDKQAPVTMQELLVSTFAQGDALAKLLIEKGLIGEKSIWREALTGAKLVSTNLRENKRRAGWQRMIDRANRGKCTPQKNNAANITEPEEVENEISFRAGSFRHYSDHSRFVHLWSAANRIAEY